ncbi:MAG TPA: ComEC/Rec2 family competence protein [Propionibacteriaceae bacterium]
MAQRERRSEDNDPVAPVDLRLVPVAVAGWAAGWFGTWGTSAAWAGLGTGVVIVVVAAVLRRSAWLVGTALMMAVVGVLGGAYSVRLQSGPLAELAHGEAVVSADLVVRTDPSLRPAKGAKPAYATLDTTLVAVTGRGETWRMRAPVLVVAGGDTSSTVTGLVVGSRVRVSGRLASPDRGDAIAAVLRVRGAVEIIRPPGAAASRVERIRAGLRRSVEHRRPEPRALVPALVLGDTSRVQPELVADFQTTGLTHLTAVSGANLTLLLAFLLVLARWVGVRGWWLRVVGLAGVAVFIALCRTEPSVLRAAAMGLVALAALGAGGRRAGLRNLSVAMIVLLLVDPFLSRSLGFALSVLASGGIIWWARSWAQVLNRWLPQVVAELVSVPLAAHLATLAVVAGISGQISVSGLLTNALAGPFVGPATVLGFAAAGASQISAVLAAVFGFGAAWSAQAIIWVAHVGAGLPGSSWQWPVNPVALTWLGVASLLVGMVMRWVLVRPWLTLGLSVAMVAGLAGAPAQPGWPPHGWLVVACDIGQGDGLVVRSGPHAAMVVDAGPDPAPMDRCLDQLEIEEVPLVVLTHFHADHVDGLTGVFDGRRVGQVWVNPLSEPGYEVDRVRRLAATHHASISTPPPGLGATVGEVELRVVGPVSHPMLGEDTSSVQNDSSLVVLARVDGLTILLTGDVEPPGQRAILATGVDLRADVLKIPHHGSARQEPAFFAATHASVAIASAGVDNDYGHPAPRTVQLAQSLGMTVLHTDRDGAVAVSRQDGVVSVVSQK